MEAAGDDDADASPAAVVVSTGADSDALSPFDAAAAASPRHRSADDAAAFAAPSSDSTPSAASQRTRLLPAQGGSAALPSHRQPPRHPGAGGASSRRVCPTLSDASPESVSANPLQAAAGSASGPAAAAGSAPVAPSTAAAAAPGLRTELNKARRASVEQAVGTLPLIRASGDAVDALATASNIVRRRHHSVDGAGAASLGVFPPAAFGSTTPTATASSSGGAAAAPTSVGKHYSGAAPSACRLETFAEWGLTLDTCVRSSAIPAAYADLLEAPAAGAADAAAAGVSLDATGAGAGAGAGAAAGGAATELSRSVPLASAVQPSTTTLAGKRASVTSVGGKRRLRGLSEGTASELASDTVQHPRTVSGISLSGGGAKGRGRASMWGAIGGRPAGAGGRGGDYMGIGGAGDASAAEREEAEEEEEAYEAEVVVRDADSARSVSRTVASSHAHLRNITLDPVSSLLHMGSLIGPTALATADRAGEAPHPLAQVVFAIFPERTASRWNVVDRVLDGVDSLRASRRLRRVTTAADVSDLAAVQAAAAASPAAAAAGSGAYHDGRWSASAAVGVVEEAGEGEGGDAAGAALPATRSRAATTGMV
jgi:hypothetical protein